MSGHRWSKFWWADWQNDNKLRVCSYAARGLWIGMLAIMHEASPRGHLLVNGKPVSTARLAALTHGREREVAKLLAELETEGVFRRTDDDVIYSRRMVEDTLRSEAGRDYGVTGGNPNLKARPKPSGKGPGNPGGQQGGLTPPVNPEQNPPQKPLEAEAESEAKNPPSSDDEGAARGAAGGADPFLISKNEETKSGDVLIFEDEAQRVRRQLWDEGRAILGRIAPAMTSKDMGMLVGQMAKTFGSGPKGGGRAIQALRDVELRIASGEVPGYGVAGTPSAKAKVVATYARGLAAKHTAEKEDRTREPKQPHPDALKPGGHLYEAEEKRKRFENARLRFMAENGGSVPHSHGTVIDSTAEAV